MSDDKYELGGVEIDEEEITYPKADDKLKDLAVNLNKVRGRTPPTSSMSVSLLADG